MTDSEIITTQQKQIETLLELCKKCAEQIQDMNILVNWQKIEIKMVEQKQFVVNNN